MTYWLGWSAELLAKKKHNHRGQRNCRLNYSGLVWYNWIGHFKTLGLKLGLAILILKCSPGFDRTRHLDWYCLKDCILCSFLLITSSSKRLKLILKFSEIMPLYPGGAFRCGDNGLIHWISFKPVVYQPAQYQMDRLCMMLQFLANPIFTQFAKALTCNIY